jgi:hypothetical protein
LTLGLCSRILQKENKNSIPQIVLAMQNEIAVSIFVDLISGKIAIDYQLT